MEAVLQAIVNFIPAVLIAVAGIWTAYNKGEKIDAPIFLKTLIVGALTAGLITATQAAELSQFAASTVVTGLIDSIVNAMMNKHKRTAAPPPGSAPSTGP